MKGERFSVHGFRLGLWGLRLGEKGLRVGAYGNEALDARGGGGCELHLLVVQCFRVRLLPRATGHRQVFEVP